MDCLDAGVEAHFLGGIYLGLRRAAAFAFVDEVRERCILRRRRFRQRMIRCDRHELRAEQRIRPRGEHVEFGFARWRRFRIEREADEQSLRAADPVALHDAHFLRPAVERVDRVEQVLRVVADGEEPLRQFALFDQCAASPAAAVDHLLVGEHGIVDRIPVHLRLLAFDQPRREEVEEHRLLMFVVIGIAGRDLARPVQRQSHRLQLRLHLRDVLVGPGLGMDLALHRRVLRRHAERVPAHRVQHREAARAFVARHHVAHRVVAHVPHMDAPRRVGEHLQHVVFRARVVVLRGEDGLIVPGLLPARLGVAGVVAVGFH